jgi:hypothetical protein
MFAACKKGGSDNGGEIKVPAYEILNKMTENNGDYVVDIVVPEYNKSTSEDTLQAVSEKIAKTETADIIFIFNEKPKEDKKQKEYVRPESGLVGVFENGKFSKK